MWPEELYWQSSDISSYLQLNKSDPEEVGDTDSAFDFIGDFGTIGHIIFIAVALGYYWLWPVYDH
jgi:hypothetical protein